MTEPAATTDNAETAEYAEKILCGFREFCVDRRREG
jgi:hypothetical protein